MANYKIERFKTKDDLAEASLGVILKIIQSALEVKDRVQIALSGGSTPSAVYQLLSKADIDWNCVDIFLGDERWVDPQDQSSNALMLRKTLLSNSPGSQACFHEVPTTQFPNPYQSVDYLEQLLKQKCVGSPPVFDLMLLGLGEDGHTASLFPYSDSLKVFDRWVTLGNGKGHDRITLTSPVLSAAKNVVFLVSGSSKQIALKRLIDPSEPSNRTPAKLVQPVNEILVLADNDSSALI